MKKPTKQKLVLDPKSRIQTLTTQDLEKVEGGGLIPRVRDASGDPS
jgi:hypothetical protein